MAFHGFIFLVAGALAAMFVLKLFFETTAPAPNSEYMDGSHQGCRHRRADLGDCWLPGRRLDRLAACLPPAQPRSAVDELRPAPTAARLGCDRPLHCHGRFRALLFLLRAVVPKGVMAQQPRLHSRWHRSRPPQLALHPEWLPTINAGLCWGDRLGRRVA